MLIEILKKYWRDISTFTSLFLLTSVSIYKEYHLGMLIGFLILSVFFSYERIKRIIVELNIKKIFGVEFGEIEKAEIVESFKNELKTHGTPLEDSEIENIAEIALNQIQGVAYKGRYFEEMVSYALKDLNADVQNQVSGSVGRSKFHIDFVVDLGDTRAAGIEVVYSNQRYLSKNKIEQIRQYVEAASKVDNFVSFLLVTNSEVRDTDMVILRTSTPPIILVDKVVSSDGLLSRIGEYLKSVQ